MLRAVFLFLFIAIAFAIPIALFHPESPLPDEWHPFEPLAVSDPVTPLTAWKLRRTLEDPQLCLEVLSDAADFEVLEDQLDGPNCGISPRLKIASVGSSQLDDLETTCATALTTALWEHHSLQPRAEEYLGGPISRNAHSGSYSCRMIRTPSGEGRNWSTHARALALDVAGFETIDGERLRLLDDWEGSDSRSTYLKAVRDDACDWFGLTLSPDFNALHADHFHLQVFGWGGCR